MTRPAVDVVIPFAGPAAAFERLATRVGRLELREGDTLLVVDNRASGGAAPTVPTLRAPEVRSSYFARNRGAAAGAAPWIVVLDADVQPAPGLLDAYFDPPPGDDVGALAGRVEDERADDALGAAMTEHASLSQAITLDRPWAYAQTASCAVRRAAFEAVGGFDATVRSGGDADLCFRLHEAGWRLERRDRALVTHDHRRTLRALARQKARHGAGAAWLEGRWPGSMPPRPAREVVAYAARGALAAGSELARGDREAARSARPTPTCR